ncbi:hypothetical protein ILUMI_04930 [Ignelater luminosus]|uniref:Uncharacterized protein n=1 Tax=Ignelater luminosus TaxID=2038154 RepID=A0A8K0DDJ2_IGNLU|nr:hypothetical protein ILUMI_04930 [Ignelater luminosus]
MLRSILLLLAVFTISFAEEDIQKEDETVTILDLSNQGITTLDDHNFTKYKDLEEVDLSNNDLQFIKEDAFTHNAKLKKLNLSGNKNLKLPGFSTFLIANIEELNLSNCNIEELPPNILDGLTDLKILDLSGNPLIEESITESTISNLNSPKKIILPYVDEEMIKKICHEVDIMFEIKSEDHTASIPCKDVREGTWQNIPKESDDNENTETEDQNKDQGLQVVVDAINEEKIKNNDETQHEENNDETQHKENNDETQHEENNDETQHENNTEPQPDIAELNTDNGTENNGNEEIKIDNTDTEVENTENNNNTETKTETVEDNNNNQANLENTENNENGDNELHVEPSTENPDPQIYKHLYGIYFCFTDKTKANTVEESSGAGSSILVILVIAVVVAGAVAFGYKFYKTRKYEAARTAEPMERELKEIVVDKKPNGTSKAGDTIEEKEEEPLMEKRENSVEIKEIDETNESQAPRNEKPIVNETISSNPPTSNPYVPTTTPIKPPHQTLSNKDDDKAQI